MRKRGGDRTGIPNVVSATAKENIIAVFTRLGGTAEMAAWARKNQTDFYKIYGRLIPTDVNHSGSIGQYTAIPTEQRDIDAVASAVGATADGNPSQPH
jgi:hypothetical protein